MRKKEFSGRGLAHFVRDFFIMMLILERKMDKVLALKAWLRLVGWTQPQIWI